MKQLRAPGLKRILAGFGALSISGTVLMSLFAVMLVPKQASAQAVPFDYANIGTITHGSDAFYDVDPFDGQRGFGNTAKGNCSLAGGVQNVPMERIIADAPPAGFGTFEFVDTNAKNGSGALLCQVKSERVTIGNVQAAKLLFYRSGDTVYTYNSGMSFVKTNTINGAEVFTRSGEQTDICPDIIVRQPAGQWLVFPMAGKDDTTATSAKSEVYQDSFGFPGTLDKCRVAPVELATQFHVAGMSSSPGGPVDCGVADCNDPLAAPILAPNFTPINGDDGYIIVNGVGNESNAPPASSPPPGAASGDNQFVEERSACTVAYNAVDTLTFKWLFCGIINMMMSAIQLLEDFINNLLVFDTTPLEPNSAFHKVWASFRALALGIIVMVTLVIVGAQATGVEAFSAVTVRSAMARLGVAVLFIVISFPFLKEIMEIVNGIMLGTRSIVYAPFNNISPQHFSTGAYGLSLLLGTGALAIFGPIGLMSFAGTALLSVALTSLIIIVAHSILYILILVSPIAIAFAVLPNTRNIFQFMQNAFTSIVFGLIAVSFVMAALRVISISTASLNTNSAVDQLIALVERAAIPFIAAIIFMRIGGVIGNITNAGKGAFQRGFGALSSFRVRRAQALHQERMEGRGRLFGSNTLAGAYRRAGSAKEGGLSVTSRGRARYRASEQKRLMDVTDKMLEQDKGFVANDDDANALALQDGMTRSQFVDRLVSSGRSRKAAEQSLGAMERSYGARMGTSAMQLAALRARAASPTGYIPDPNDPNAHYAQFTQDAASLISKGLLTSETATSLFKQNKSRADISGIGFTDLNKHLSNATRRYEAGARGEQLLGANEGIRKATVKTLKQSALKGTAPGALVGGRHEAVAALAPQMQADLEEAIGRGDREDALRQLAQIGGRYDVMAQIAPQSAELMRQHVMSQMVPVPGNATQSISVQELLENNRPDFVQWRREYATTAAAQAAHMQQMAGGQPGGGPPLTPPAIP
jgi:hypothetical protein